MSSSEISFYVDCLVVEALAQDGLTKHAAGGGMVMALIDKVKEYVMAHIDQSDKLGSVLNILAPVGISALFSALGFGWLGKLLALAASVFNINVGGILRSIYGSIKGMLGSGQQVTSSQVDSAVQSAVQDQSTPLTQEHADALAQKMKAQSFEQIMQDARFVKIAMMQYQDGTISKSAGLLDALKSRQAKTGSILSRVLGWIFKIALSAAGFMVAGDVVNKLLGRPNALDGSMQGGKAAPASPPMPASTQTKFKGKSSYRIENYNVGDSPWVERVTNNDQGIGDMIVGFAKDVYDGLDGKENIIRQTAGFQAIQSKIADYNHSAEGGPIVYIPPMFRSKKQLVDYFIDDVAEKSP